MEVCQTRCQTLLIFTSLPDEASAQEMAAALVNGRLASCVNVMAPCRSVYRWQGKIEEAQEVPLLIKATTAAYPALEAAIRARHPYELPEIIAVPIAHGLPEYLAWIAAEALAEHTDGNPTTC